ncbi:hypothetical protein HNQ80_004600 [Anaerosolibacter carboniphilus]|uniref:Uncharacterized protein n=1 Tax=Anaerosolibacter carboniphilus TaxID=1417629 RepID=A0A841KXH8_9FIRM|nr:hypothetical protein [Anaerosolibacter carboniphilus]
MKHLINITYVSGLFYLLLRGAYIFSKNTLLNQLSSFFGILVGLCIIIIFVAEKNKKEMLKPFFWSILVLLTYLIEHM